jgi:hypothetical protein
MTNRKEKTSWTGQEKGYQPLLLLIPLKKENLAKQRILSNG